ARDGAALPAKERLAGDGLPRFELVAGELAHTPGDLSYLLQPQVGLDAVERAQRQRDLAQVRVAGPFAHAVDRPVHPARSRTYRRGGGGRREAEVVGAVEMDGHVRANPLDGAADKVRDRLGRGDPERVHDRDLLCTRFHGGLVDLLVEVRLRAGGV